MTITFRVDDGHNVLSPSPAVIIPDQLGALRELLSDYTARTGDAMVISIHGDSASGSFEIEVRVCPFALASIARCFDYDPAVMVVIDEAQFRARRARLAGGTDRRSAARPWPQSRWHTRIGGRQRECLRPSRQPRSGEGVVRRNPPVAAPTEAYASGDASTRIHRCLDTSRR